MRPLHLLVSIAVLTLGCAFDPVMEGVAGTDTGGTSSSGGEPGSSVTAVASTSSSSTSSSSTTSTAGSESSDSGSSTSFEESSESSSTGSLQDHALGFEGGQRGLTDALPGLPMQYTIEFELRTDGDLHGAMLSTADGGPPVSGWFFYQEEAAWTAFDNVLVFIDYNAPTWDYLVDSTLDVNAQPGWHHVAVTKDSTGLLKLYFDGTRVAQNQRSTPFSVVESDLQIGAHMNGGVPLYGAQIDNLRISSGLRYADTFDPPAEYEVDGTALYLWRFDEGDGDVAQDDVAGVEFDLVDPLWIER